MIPKWPVYIPTKGRAESRLTIQMFDRLRVPYTIFVEAQEFDAYAQHVPIERIHVLPHAGKGVTVTRNYIWDYAARRGHEWYWSFDDNISELYRFNHNRRIRCDASVMAAIEDFASRYENIAITGMHYRWFFPSNVARPPYFMNSRVYSNMLIRTFAESSADGPYRFATFFNEDTEICLRVLKDGWCTVLFNAFLIEKATTMTMTGGNTEYYAETQKRLEFVEELRRAHPDVVKLTEKYGRWHHHVDYSRFRQQLRRREGVEIPRGVNNFGMVLQERTPGTQDWRAVVQTIEPVAIAAVPVETPPPVVVAPEPEEFLYAIEPDQSLEVVEPPVEIWTPPSSGRFRRYRWPTASTREVAQLDLFA